MKGYLRVKKKKMLGQLPHTMTDTCLVSWSYHSAQKRGQAPFFFFFELKIECRTQNSSEKDCLSLCKL